MPLDESAALPRIREIIADHQALEGPLLPMLNHLPVAKCCFVLFDMTHQWVCGDASSFAAIWRVGNVRRVWRLDIG